MFFASSPKYRELYEEVFQFDLIDKVVASKNLIRNLLSSEVAKR